VEVDRGGWTRVELGAPRPERDALVGFELPRDATVLSCVPIDLGVCHVVVELDTVEGLAVAELGAAIEQQGCFAPPLRLVFVSRADGELLHLRRWEPGGVGDARACGTAAASAAYVVATRTGQRRGRWRVCSSGGEVYVTLGDGDRLVLEARAIHVFDALVDLRGVLYAA
jgi:diaminopimelate epimerase